MRAGAMDIAIIGLACRFPGAVSAERFWENLAAGIESVAFDRSGFRYHGRIQALADAAREAGLKF